METPKPDKFGPEAMIDKLEAAIKKIGVQTYILVAVDPDSDSDVTLRSGSLLWAVGALRATEKEMIHKRVPAREGEL